MEQPNETDRILLETARFAVHRVIYAGRNGALQEREIIRHPGAVTIVPIVDADHVCLIRNRRIAVGETLIELPAGTLEPPETPLQTAARELTEETGYRADHFECVRSFYLSPGILDESMHLFVATGLTATSTNRQPDEEIENLVVTWRDAIEMAYNGQIRDAKSIVGILHVAQYLKLNEGLQSDQRSGSSCESPHD